MNLVTTFLFAFSSLFAAELSNICGTPETFGLADTNRVWDKKELTVCFASQEDDLQDACLVHTKILPKEEIEIKISPVSEDQKKKIQSAIENSYKAATTGIHFTGWKPCSSFPKDAPSDIVVFLEENPNPKLGFLAAGSIGDPKKEKPPCKRTSVFISGNFYKSEKKLEDKFKKFQKGLAASTEQSLYDDRLETIAAHEFGHIAGLFHEHLSPEFKKSEDKVVTLPGAHQYFKNTAFNPPEDTKNKNLIANYYDFKISFLGDADFQSTMSYSRDVNNLFGSYVNALCKKLSSLKTEEISQFPILQSTADILSGKTNAKPKAIQETLNAKLCAKNFSALKFHNDPTYGYLSRGDVETLSHLYLKTEKLYSKNKSDKALQKDIEMMNEKFESLAKLWGILQ